MSIYQRFNQYLSPTADQEEALHQLDRFLRSPDQEVFILKGYAGTGKTSIIKAVADELDALGRSFVLMAPTGKAAKVIKSYTGRFASTIHLRIYNQKRTGGSFRFALAHNNGKGTLFIVDEASMIGKNAQGFGGNSLLEDLIEYVYTGVNCKLMLVGDIAQLPPVGESRSSALSPNYIHQVTGVKPFHVTLKHVVRQALDSGILFNATQIRGALKKGTLTPPTLQVSNFSDVHRITGAEVQEHLEAAYQHFGINETVVLTRSNKSANVFNQQIRSRVLFLEDEVAAGEQLMVVKNNYQYTKEYRSVGFIANGDSIEVLRVQGDQNLYNKRFLDVACTLKDHKADPELEVKILLESLLVDGPSLSQKAMDSFAEEISKDYPEITSQKQLFLKLKEHPYYHALQVKYGYAITGHKAQGGQWDCVFIDQSFFTEEMLTIDYLRWLYTCMTRAKKQLYLINFNDIFFEN